MVHQSTRRRVFDALLESLGRAERGSRELDIVVCYLLGDSSSEAGDMVQVLVEEGYPWDVVSELLDAELPPYTTSLDAALPGENIVVTLHSRRRGKWAAVHRTPKGGHVLVWARSECLARRRAALKGLRVALTRRPSNASEGAAPRTQPQPQPQRMGHGATPSRGWSRPAAARSPQDGETEEDAGDWKILF